MLAGTGRANLIKCGIDKPEKKTLPNEGLEY
jgi:hypothetical protein